MSDQATVSTPKVWKVTAEHERIRIDHFVRICLPHLSRRRVERAIGEQLFLLNGRVSKKGERVNVGDVLAFHGPVGWLRAQPAADSELEMPIVYEDPAVIVLDKPAGMPTHGFSGRDEHTVANFIAAKYPALLGVGKSRWEPGILHRLDRETSGLLLVAKTQKAFDHLREQFRRRQIVKTYWALVWGETDARGTIDLPLAHDPRDKRRMQAAVAPQEKRRSWRAVTSYQKLRESCGVSLLEISMTTGVTHQIRVHLAAIGHPIIADRLYAAGRATFGLQRQFLHAQRLDFQHPQIARQLFVESRLPTDLLEVLRRLKIDDLGGAAADPL